MIRHLMISALSLSILFTTVDSTTAWHAPAETTVTELAPGVYFRQAQTEPTFTGCNQGWIIFKNFVLVIDANFPNQAEEVIELIRKQTDKPIRYVFDTHHHGDHADGNVKYVRLGAAAIASERSRAMFETKGITGFEQSQQSNPDEYGDLTYEKPTVYFPGKLVIDDGQQRLELLHLGHAHTMGDAVAWLPKHGVLFTGDACVNGAYNYTGDSDTESWISVLNAMEKLPIKKIAPGHGELSDKGLIAKQRRYFVELRSQVQTAIDQKKSLEQVKQSIKIPFYKEWTGVEASTREENIEHVYQELSAAP